jgi:hypothetical protein
MASAARKIGTKKGAVETGPLAVHVECSGFVFAIEARWVDRLVLIDEAKVVKSTPKDALLGVIDVDGHQYVGWDLGQLLGLKSSSTAWVLTTGRRSESRQVPLALRTGSCLVVQPIPPRTDLPSGIFASRLSALGSAYSTGDLKRTTIEAPVGLVLDPTFLWTPEERATADGLLAAAPTPKG